MSMLNNQKFTKISALMGFRGSVEREKVLNQLDSIQQENLNHTKSRTLPFQQYCSNLQKQISDYQSVTPKRITSLCTEINQYIDKKKIDIKGISNINDIHDNELKEMLYEFNSMQKNEKVCQNFLSEIKDTLDFCRDEIKFAFKQSNLIDNDLKQLSFNIDQSNKNVHEILNKHLPFNTDQNGNFVSSSYLNEASKLLDTSLSSANKDQKLTNNLDLRKSITASPSP